MKRKAKLFYNIYISFGKISELELFEVVSFGNIVKLLLTLYLIKLIYLGKWLEKFERVYNNFKTSQEKWMDLENKINENQKGKHTHTHTHTFRHI